MNLGKKYLTCSLQIDRSWFRMDAARNKTTIVASRRNEAGVLQEIWRATTAGEEPGAAVIFCPPNDGEMRSWTQYHAGRLALDATSTKTTITAFRRNGAGVREDIWRATTTLPNRGEGSSDSGETNHQLNPQSEHIQTEKPTDKNDRILVEAEDANDALRKAGQEIQRLQAKIQQGEETHQQELQRRDEAKAKEIDWAREAISKSLQQGYQEAKQRLQSQLEQAAREAQRCHEQIVKELEAEVHAAKEAYKRDMGERDDLLQAQREAHSRDLVMFKDHQEAKEALKREFEAMRSRELDMEGRAEHLRLMNQILSSDVSRLNAERRYWLSEIRAIRDGAISIIARMRPRTRDEEAAGKQTITLQRNHNDGRPGHFQLCCAGSEVVKGGVVNVGARIDRIVGPDDEDEQVWDAMGPCLCGALLNGQKAAVIAHGQTNAGKTYAIKMLLTETAKEIASHIAQTHIQDKKHKDMAVSVSMVENYTDLVYDLLVPGSGDSKKKGSGMKVEQVVGLFAPSRDPPPSSSSTSIITRVLVEWSPSSSSAESFVAELMGVIKQGNQARTTRATAKNSTSSRSHAILVLRFHRGSKDDDDDGDNESHDGLLTFVDLAGNESLQASQGLERGTEETKSINTSLTVLGRALRAIAQNKQGGHGHVPVRDSALTKLLRPVLVVGNEKGDKKNKEKDWGLFLLLALSPLEENLSGTKVTLQLATDLGR